MEQFSFKKYSYWSLQINFILYENNNPLLYIIYNMVLDYKRMEMTIAIEEINNKKCLK